MAEGAPSTISAKGGFLIGLAVGLGIGLLLFLFDQQRHNEEIMKIQESNVIETRKAIEARAELAIKSGKGSEIRADTPKTHETEPKSVNTTETPKKAD